MVVWAYSINKIGEVSLLLALFLKYEPSVLAQPPKSLDTSLRVSRLVLAVAVANLRSFSRYKPSGLIWIVSHGVNISDFVDWSIRRKWQRRSSSDDLN